MMLVWLSRSGTLPGPWIMEALGELIVAVEGCQGTLAPVLAVLKRSAVRWFTCQKTSEDGDRMRFLAHAQHLRDVRNMHRLKAKAVRENRDKKAQGTAATCCFVRCSVIAVVKTG